MTRAQIISKLSTSGELLLFIYVMEHGSFRIKDIRETFEERGVNTTKLKRCITTLTHKKIIERKDRGYYVLTATGKAVKKSK